MPNYRGNEKQDLMIPVCLDDQLVPGTIEHTIDWIVDREIDTSVFGVAYHNDHGGRSAYDPAALVKIILFAYSKGILSSRKIEEACRTNVVFMALSGDIRPDHATIARFVTGHPGAVRRVFRDVLMIAAQGDLIGGDVFALDGCTISSNAAREHAGTRRELERKVEKLEARLEAMVHTHRDTDKQHDLDDDEPNGPGSGGVHRYRAQIDRIKRFLDTHPPRIGTSGREVKSNITDNQSATLNTGSGSLQGYNALAMVDANHQIVLHAEAVGQIHEAPLLPRMVRRSLHALRGFAHPQIRTATILADTNYFTEANARFLIDSRLDGYIPDHQFRNRDTRFAAPGCMGEQQSAGLRPAPDAWECVPRIGTMPLRYTSEASSNPPGLRPAAAGHAGPHTGASPALISSISPRPIPTAARPVRSCDGVPGRWLPDAEARATKHNGPTVGGAISPPAV